MKYAVTYQQYPAVGNQIFICDADNQEHAQHQCRKAYPNADVRGAVVVETGASLKPRELRNLLNRAAAALETPADLSDEDRKSLIEDLVVAAQHVDG